MLSIVTLTVCTVNLTIFCFTAHKLLLLISYAGVYYFSGILNGAAHYEKVFYDGPYMKIHRIFRAKLSDKENTHVWLLAQYSRLEWRVGDKLAKLLYLSVDSELSAFGNTGDNESVITPSNKFHSMMVAQLRLAKLSNISVTQQHNATLTAADMIAALPPPPVNFVRFVDLDTSPIVPLPLPDNFHCCDDSAVHAHTTVIHHDNWENDMRLANLLLHSIEQPLSEGIVQTEVIEFLKQKRAQKREFNKLQFVSYFLI